MMDTDVRHRRRAVVGMRSRRRLLGTLAGTAGAALVVGAANRIPALADDDGSSGDKGSGRGRGRGGDNRGDGETVVIQGEIPAGSVPVRIVSDDAGGFVPAELTLDLGQSVSFVNAHNDAHTATGSGFDTGIIPPGTIATVTLDEPGQFAYACQIHPVMTGRIAVRDVSVTVPTAAPAATPAAGATTVRIAALAFDPATNTIPPGTTVVWTNDDAVPHTVTALDDTFDSGIFDPGSSFSHTFAAPGAYDYRCLIHPQMQGRVLVEGAAAPDVPAAAGTSAASPPEEPVTAPDEAAATSTNAPIGVWLVLVSPDEVSDFGPQRALLTLHPDGLLEAAFVPTGEASPAALAIAPAQGVWEPSGVGSYALTILALLLDSDGQFAATLTLRLTARLADDDATFQGTFTYAQTQADGTVGASGTGTVRGERSLLPPP